MDSQDPGSYTRSGLEVVFRPHAERFNSGATEAKPSSFFKGKDFETEEDQRASHKWETAMHKKLRFRGASLHRPVLDIHYVARESGGPARSGADKIRYALVVTVSNQKTPHLYDNILQAYATFLEPIEPVIEIPIQVQ